MTLASILISFSRMQRGQGCDQVDRLSCRTFAANAFRLQLYALAYNLGNFMRTASHGRWSANCQVFVGHDKYPDRIKICRRSAIPLDMLR
jgi:hypothetical protein